MGRTSFAGPKHRGPYAFDFRLHKSTNDYQEAMKLVDKQYLKIIEVHPPINLYVIYPFCVIYKFDNNMHRHLTRLTIKRSWS